MHKKLSIIVLATLLLISITLLASLYIKFWLLEIIVSQLLLLVLLITLVVVFIGIYHTRRRKSSLSYAIVVPFVASIFVLVLTFSQGLSLVNPQTFPSYVSSPDYITFASYNKLYTNNDLDSALEYLKEADIISFQEITAQQLDYYAQATDNDFTAITNRETSAANTEIAIASKYKILSSETIELSSADSCLRAIIQLDGGMQVAVYAVHIRPPFSPALYSSGLDSFDTLANLLADDPLPVLMAGDFNTTLFSPKMTSFRGKIEEKRIFNSNYDAVPQCSWFHAIGPLNLCMRIDHVFYSSDTFRAENTSIAEPTGSDHRIITTNLHYSAPTQ